MPEIFHFQMSKTVKAAVTRVFPQLKRLKNVFSFCLIGNSVYLSFSKNCAFICQGNCIQRLHPLTLRMLSLTDVLKVVYNGGGFFGKRTADPLGAKGNQKQTGIVMRCYSSFDWYKNVSNWLELWGRWLLGRAVIWSDVCQGFLHPPWPF